MGTVDGVKGTHFTPPPQLPEGYVPESANIGTDPNSVASDIPPARSIGYWQEKIHQIAIDKNWWDDNIPRSFGDLIALCHSELSEALEEFRTGRGFTEIYYDEWDVEHAVEPRKPEGIPIELADVVIRILDMAGRYGIDLEEAMRLKCEYNKTRPNRHGGKAI